MLKRFRVITRLLYGIRSLDTPIRFLEYKQWGSAIIAIKLFSKYDFDHKRFLLKVYSIY